MELVVMQKITKTHIFNNLAQPLFNLNRLTNHSWPSDPHCIEAEVCPQCRKSAFKPPTYLTVTFRQCNQRCYLFRHGLFKLVVEQALVDFAFSSLNLRRMDTWQSCGTLARSHLTRFIAVRCSRAGRTSRGRPGRRSRGDGPDGSRPTTAQPPAGWPSGSPLWLVGSDLSAPPPLPRPSPGRQWPRPENGRPRGGLKLVSMFLHKTVYND